MKPIESNARNVSERWLSAVNALDLETLLSLYSEDSVLLPTFSPNIIRNTEDLREYFTTLAKHPGLAVSLKEETFTTQTSGNQEIASGVYYFHWEIDGAPHSFESRFTFVIDPDSERPILHHHSSEMPNGPKSAN